MRKRYGKWFRICEVTGICFVYSLPFSSSQFQFVLESQDIAEHWSIKCSISLWKRIQYFRQVLQDGHTIFSFIQFSNIHLKILAIEFSYIYFSFNYFRVEEICFGVVPFRMYLLKGFVRACGEFCVLFDGFDCYFAFLRFFVIFHIGTYLSYFVYYNFRNIFLTLIKDFACSGVNHVYFEILGCLPKISQICLLSL